MLSLFNSSFDDKYPLIIEWENNLRVKCNSITAIYETDTEPDDEDYIGEYAAGVGDVEILNPGNDNSVLIYCDSIEICLNCIPKKIMLEDGTVLWDNKK